MLRDLADDEKEEAVPAATTAPAPPTAPLRPVDTWAPMHGGVDSHGVAYTPGWGDSGSRRQRHHLDLHLELPAISDHVYRYDLPPGQHHCAAAGGAAALPSLEASLEAGAGGVAWLI